MISIDDSVSHWKNALLPVCTLPFTVPVIAYSFIFYCFLALYFYIIRRNWFLGFKENILAPHLRVENRGILSLILRSTILLAKKHPHNNNHHQPHKSFFLQIHEQKKNTRKTQSQAILVILTGLLIWMFGSSMHFNLLCVHLDFLNCRVFLHMAEHKKYSVLSVPDWFPFCYICTRYLRSSDNSLVAVHKYSI